MAHVLEDFENGKALHNGKHSNHYWQDKCNYVWVINATSDFFFYNDLHCISQIISEGKSHLTSVMGKVQYMMINLEIKWMCRARWFCAASNNNI